MKQINTRAIVLARRNYGEADRIVNLITSDSGKISIIAKGARKQASKLAGGIELFSQNDVTFIDGKNELKTLVSSRMKTHYGNITKGLDATMWLYEVLKLYNSSLPDNVDTNFYDLLSQLIESIDSMNSASLWANKLWFYSQWLELHGQMPNTIEDSTGQKLAADQKYQLALDQKTFIKNNYGAYTDKHIKLIRLAQSSQPARLAAVQGGGSIASTITNDFAKLAKTVV